MKTQTRIFWLLSQFSFTAGCSGYQVACYTKSEDPTGFIQEASEDCQLEPGDHVILALVDGERENGKSCIWLIRRSSCALGKSLQPRGYTSADSVHRKGIDFPCTAAAGFVLLPGASAGTRERS